MVDFAHKMRNKKILIGIIFGLVAISAAIFVYAHNRTNSADSKRVGESLWSDTTVHDAIISIADTQVEVSIARTPQEQEQGLSGTASLLENSGKLFIFNTPGTYGFWMKDMHYPLDLVWIDANHKIVDITENVAPDTYPQIFYPGSPVTAVLELNAGFSTKHGLSIGEMPSFKK